MVWRDELLVLRNEVEATLARVLGEPVDEDAEVISEREEIYQLAASLQVYQMLLDVNEVVLSGTGRVESTSLMEYYEDQDILYEMEDLGEDDEDEDDEEGSEGEDLEDSEELRFSLFWDDATECAVDVELGKSNDRMYLLVNGEEVRPQREVLETAVLDAFRAEMNLDSK